jgi:hypothetical protein
MTNQIINVGELITKLKKFNKNLPVHMEINDEILDLAGDVIEESEGDVRWVVIERIKDD